MEDEGEGEGGGGLERKKRERERVQRRVNAKKRAGTEQSDMDVALSAMLRFHHDPVAVVYSDKVDMYSDDPSWKRNQPNPTQPGGGFVEN